MFITAHHFIVFKKINRTQYTVHTTQYLVNRKLVIKLQQPNHTALDTVSQNAMQCTGLDLK